MKPTCLYLLLFLFFGGMPAHADFLKIDEYREKFANPYTAASQGLVDAVIEPALTRRELIRAIEMTANKRETRPEKKHGNIPL